MTYNNQNAFGSGFGLPSSGFASRGKGSHIKHLSVGPSKDIHTIDENHAANPLPTPRTSRGHLLQGLRTVPKTPGIPPSSAPPTQLQQNVNFGPSNYLQKENNLFARGVPQTSVGSHFPKSQTDYYGHNQMYSLPEQILAPPAVQIAGEHEGNEVDPDLYSELVATNQYLAQEQRRLQQQLINVTNAATNAATQQFQGMSINGVNRFAQTPRTPQNGYYQQQLQNGLQPVVTPVPDQPGFFAVYNPMTGQQNFVFDQAAQQAAAQQVHPNHELSHSPPPLTPTFRAQVSPPPAETPSRMNSMGSARSLSPPKITATPPQETNPLPPPSANAFRPSHKKAISFASGFGSNTASPSENAKSAGMPKSAGFPQTPMTGTFGPGQGRAGEHPVRQPRGPPSLEELVSKPTSKCEGSKNFATRQRRRAVDNIVRARLTRGERSTPSRGGSGSMDSLGSMTPASETEVNFSSLVTSDDDSSASQSLAGSRNGSLSGKASTSSLIGAIGSERKQAKEREERSRSRTGTPIRQFTADSVSSEEGLVEVKSARLPTGGESEGRNRMPLMVLNSAEKRKSSIF